MNIDQRIMTVSDTVRRNLQAEGQLGRSPFPVQPDRSVIIRILDDIRFIFFPIYFSEGRVAEDFAVQFEIGSRLSDVYSSLTEQIARALVFHPVFQEQDATSRAARAAELAETFLDRLPSVQKLLETDVQAAFDGDPAATGHEEIILSYPGYYAIMVHRVAHELYLLDVPLIPRIMSEYAHGLTGIDIHPGATIGSYFFIDHGTGVVVGETTVIGEHVKLYQGVTLGGLSTRAGQGLRGKKRHPTIEDDVTIYSNASILGGETVIGTGSVIGGNCFITASVPAHMRVSSTTP